MESLEAFSYYCCPECDHKYQSREKFIQHALKNHSNSKETFLDFTQNQTENSEEDESSELKSIIQELDGILVKFNEANQFMV